MTSLKASTTLTVLTASRSPIRATNTAHVRAVRQTRRVPQAAYAHRLDAKDPVVVANAMLIIIGRALNMLKSQIEAQGKAFEESGGFSERLTAKRLEAREGQKNIENSPACPQCQRPEIHQRRLLGLLRLPGLQKHPAPVTRQSSPPPTSTRSTRSMQSTPFHKITCQPFSSPCGCLSCASEGPLAAHFSGLLAGFPAAAAHLMPSSTCCRAKAVLRERRSWPNSV